MNLVLDRAVQFLTQPSETPPPPDAVVEALQQAEKATKQGKVRHAYSQLLGRWRLGFITGTKRSRQRAGIVLGAGRFLPKWVEIHLSYSAEPDTVENSVKLGGLQIVLVGPVKFRDKMNLLAFDFTRMKVFLAGVKLYEGNIRGGGDREANFDQQSLKEQAFFQYFLVQDDRLAARGRGGGLALWTRGELKIKN